MKCAKCQYLGFETGSRCRNCGYDFSLLALADAVAADDAPLLRPEGRRSEEELDDLPLMIEPVRAEEHVPRRMRPPAPAEDTGDTAGGHGPVSRAEELPLFAPPDDADVPLIRVAPAPRVPLAVRRTPDVPKVSRPPAAVRRDARPIIVTADALRVAVDERPARSEAAGGGRSAPGGERCGARARALAAAIDGAILGGMYVVVLYFTMRMAGLSMGEWMLLPAVPLLGFLAFLTLAYVAVFTALGGQTIGKMAAHIRVVSEDGLMTASQALARALAVAGSMATLGVGFVPAFIGDGRALHDRVARTRVVAVRSAA